MLITCQIKPTKILLFIICSLLPGLGCQGYSVTGGPAPLVKRHLATTVNDEFKALTINEVSVLPLESATGSVMPVGLSQRLTEQMLRVFQLETSIELSLPQIAKEDNIQFSDIGVGIERLRKHAREVGITSQAQGVLYGIISRYEEGNAGRLGGANPAAVGFKLWLLDPNSNKVLWEASYERTEKPLSDNLFEVREKIKSGVGYESSSDLMLRGFREAARSLELLRKGAVS